MNQAHLISILPFLVLPLAGGWANVLTLHPVADTTLLEIAPTNSAGGQGFFIAGTTQNSTRNRGLLRFDLAPVLPGNATILSATLDLDVIQGSSTAQENSLFGLHRLLQPWGEGSTIAPDNPGGRGGPAMPGDATWLYRSFQSTTWTAPGGAAGIDYTSAFSSSALISGVGTYNFESTLEMAADAQFWLSHPEANFGWMLSSESEDIPFTARRFASRENAGGGPVLTLEYTIIPEPGTWLLFSLGLAVGTYLCRRHRSKSSSSGRQSALISLPETNHRRPTG